MNEYRASVFEFFSFIILRFIFYFTVLVGIFLLFSINNFFERKIFKLSLIILPFAFSLASYLRQRTVVTITDQKFMITQGDLISKYRFDNYYVAAINTTTPIFGVIPVYNSKEIYVINKETGADEIFHLPSLSMKKYRELKKDLKEKQNI